VGELKQYSGPRLGSLNHLITNLEMLMKKIVTTYENRRRCPNGNQALYKIAATTLPSMHQKLLDGQSTTSGNRRGPNPFNGIHSVDTCGQYVSSMKM
jgi:hypothetical protein